MDNVYIIHGCCDRQEFEDRNIPSGSNFHWIPWLQKQLIIDGYNCQTPEMPTPYKPSYSAWKQIFQNFPIDENTTLIGHSCGAGFLLRYLQESKQKIRKLILVAPYIDPSKRMGSFLDFTLTDEIVNFTSSILLLLSKDEPIQDVVISTQLIQKEIPQIELHMFQNHGHFCLDCMKTEKFPELLNMVTK